MTGVQTCALPISIILNHQFELSAYNREDFAHAMEGEFQNMFDTTPAGHYSVASEE